MKKMGADICVVFLCKYMDTTCFGCHLFILFILIKELCCLLSSNPMVTWRENWVGESSLHSKLLSMTNIVEILMPDLFFCFVLFYFFSS